MLHRCIDMWLIMPSTINQGKDRKQIRLPKALVQEVDRIIEKYGHYGNRQKFIEHAISEKLDKARLIEAGLQREVEKRP